MTETNEKPDPPVTTDQTAFTFSEPLFESPPSLPQAPPEPGHKPWYLQPKALVVIGLLLFTAVIMALTLMLQSSQSLVETSPSPSPSALPRQLTQLEQRISEARIQLQAADPTKQEFPFPPVDMGITVAVPRN